MQDHWTNQGLICYSTPSRREKDQNYSTALYALLQSIRFTGREAFRMASYHFENGSFVTDKTVCSVCVEQESISANQRVYWNLRNLFVLNL